MKGFALDNNGDVIIEKNKIKMIDGVDLINQTVKTVLGTNKTEWFLNVDEGIDFNNLLGKKKDENIIRNEIIQGLQQVDSSFVLEMFTCDFDSKNRKLTISFTAKNSSDDVVSGSNEYQEVIIMPLTSKGFERLTYDEIVNKKIQKAK